MEIITSDILEESPQFLDENKNKSEKPRFNPEEFYESLITESPFISFDAKDPDEAHHVPFNPQLIKEGQSFVLRNLVTVIFTWTIANIMSCLMKCVCSVFLKYDSI